jgi:hypothetical protein
MFYECVIKKVGLSMEGASTLIFWLQKCRPRGEYAFVAAAHHFLTTKVGFA